MNKWHRLLLVGSTAALALLCGLIGDITDAMARPGGGHGYSGGGSSGRGGGGGGGGGGQLVYLLVRLVIVYPQVGVPLAVVAVVGFVFFRKQHESTEAADWDSMDLFHHNQPPPADLEKIRTLDPYYSSILFEDFLFRLYATVHQKRALPGGLDELIPYLGEGPRITLARHEPVGIAISNVVIGSMKLTNLVVPPSITGPHGEPYYIKVDATFESNMTTVDGKTTLYAVERWRLVRAASAQSKPPGSTKDFPCPNCGAKFTAGDQGQCSYCDAPVGTGAFDWLVYQIDSIKLEKRPPLLTKTVREVGTESPTIVHPMAAQYMANIHAADPHVTHEALDARLRLIYDQLNAAWTACDLRPIRGFVSDGLYDYLGYWIGSYLSQGLRNELREMRITQWALAKTVRDPYYDAVTVRIWATGYDFTVKTGNSNGKAGKIVTGSNKRLRAYSEYWTLIRSANRRGPVRADKSCPNCGSALQISMAGNCEYCSAHITSGEFDWVLSKIEQDESYA